MSGDDFFGGAFDFIKDVGTTIGDFFSGNSSDAGSIDTSGIDFGEGPNAFAFADTMSGDNSALQPGSTYSSAVNRADSQGGLGKTLGGAISSLQKQYGTRAPSGNTTPYRSEFHLQGENRAMGYQSLAAPGKGKGTASEDPKNIAAYWHALMTQFAYGAK